MVDEVGRKEGNVVFWKFREYFKGKRLFVIIVDVIGYFDEDSFGGVAGVRVGSSTE